MTEIKRIVNRRFLTVFLLAVLANILIFVYQQLGIMNISDFMFMEKQRKFFTEYLEANENADLKSGEFSDYSKDFSENENKLFVQAYNEVKRKKSYIKGYSRSIEEIIDSAHNMQDFSVFADKGTFAYKNINKTIDDFERVRSLKLFFDNDKALDKFFSYNVIFYIAYAVMIMVVYKLMEERDNGMWEIVRGTRKRISVGVLRASSLLIITCAVVAVLYFSVLLTAFIIYGGAGLGAPIQTIKQFAKYTFVQSRAGYLLYNYIFACLLIYALTCFVWMLFSVFRKRIYASAVVGIILLAETLLYIKIPFYSRYALLRQVNIIEVLNVNNILPVYENREVLGFVCPVHAITVAVLIFIIIVSCAVSVTAFIYMKPHKGAAKQLKLVAIINRRYQSILAGAPFILKEIYKNLITCRAAILFLAGLGLVIYFTDSSKVIFSQDELYRDKIYIKYAGEEYDNLKNQVKLTESTYKEAKQEYDELLDKYDRGEISADDLRKANALVQVYESEYMSVSEFCSKIDYLEQTYEEKGIRGFLISDRGYEEILGSRGKLRETIIFFVMIAVVMITTSEFFTLEYKSGIKHICKASKKGWKWFVGKKIATGFIVATVFFMLIYGTEYMMLYNMYGMPFLNAPAVSLSFMTFVNTGVTIAEWILIKVLILYITMAVSFGIAVIASALAGKSKSRGLEIIVTVVTSLVLFLLVNNIIYFN